MNDAPTVMLFIDADNVSGNVFSFLRFGTDGSAVACVSNFAGLPHEDYRVGLPWAGQWREILNTDAEAYLGSGVGNLGAVTATSQGWHGRPASASLRVPPLGTVWLASGPPPV